MLTSGGSCSVFGCRLPACRCAPGGSPTLPTSSYRARLISLILTASAIVFTDAGMPVLGPELRQSFGLTLTSLGWVGSAYALTVALLLMPASVIAGRVGPRRALQIGIALFAAGTMVIALAPNAETVIAGRVIEGIGTAIVSPTMLAALRTQCGEPCGKAIAWWSGVSSSMVAVGALAAAAMVGMTTWRVYFATAFGLLLLSLRLVSRAIPKDGQAWTPLPTRVVAGASAVFATVELALVLRRLDLLLVPLTVGAWWSGRAWYRRRGQLRVHSGLGSRAFAAPTFAGLIVSGLLYSIVFLVPLYDRMVLGLSAIAAALSLVVVAVPPIILGPSITRWSTRSGPRVPMAIGSLTLMIAMATATRWTSHVQLQDTLPALALAGIGLGALMAPSTAAAMAALPKDRVVEGSAILACARSLGVGLGAGATTVLATDRRTCDFISHLCLDALSNTLTLPLLVDAGIAALLALFLVTTLRRSVIQLS